MIRLCDVVVAVVVVAVVVVLVAVVVALLMPMPCFCRFPYCGHLQYNPLPSACISKLVLVIVSHG